eukprot:CAMPEP_0179333368 /NCGR_PEP_ID=MMETSP0797-20121207/65268_1 /TAXON_ID=47934 /ORGANISM="Dinophysis acuminata, Strain DAEP01" /LENGTH=61 /DNA_ID=CAMNT_0021046375 /DNA_START=83 /DNA_END=264 /DNA_ORIENTATION=-
MASMVAWGSDWWPTAAWRPRPKGCARAASCRRLASQCHEYSNALITSAESVGVRDSCIIWV